MLISLFALLAACSDSGNPVDGCQDNEDCLFSGVDVGKVCRQGSCVFPNAAGTTAPNFCLPVINPASEYYGSNRCLAEEKEKVVMLFFGLIA